MSFPPDWYVLGLQEIDQTQVAVVGARPRSWGSLRGLKAFTCRLTTA
jgi:predicted Rossmann fold nucleotide-binding protein DprA/Smf involved in DNA uptake